MLTVLQGDSTHQFVHLIRLPVHHQEGAAVPSLSDFVHHLLVAVAVHLPPVDGHQPVHVVQTGFSRRAVPVDVAHKVACKR